VPPASAYEDLHVKAFTLGSRGPVHRAGRYPLRGRLPGNPLLTAATCDDDLLWIGFVAIFWLTEVKT
jgi:hypothetical protein